MWSQYPGSSRRCASDNCVQMCCFHRNIFAGLYSYELWIPSAAAIEISSHGLSFLRLYGHGAKQSYDMTRRLFLMQPNLHRLHHIAWHLGEDARKMDFVPSPLAWSTQPEEDYIGRPSRVSRRVSPRLPIQRTIQRSLIAAHAAYRDAGLFIGDWWFFLYHIVHNYKKISPPLINYHYIHIISHSRCPESRLRVQLAKRSPARRGWWAWKSHRHEQRAGEGWYPMV